MRGQKFSVVNKNFVECYCLYLPVTENKIISPVWWFFNYLKCGHLSLLHIASQPSQSDTNLEFWSEQRMEHVASLTVPVKSCLWDITAFPSDTLGLLFQSVMKTLEKVYSYV